jgi:SAM-dependent methyltransferase
MFGMTDRIAGVADDYDALHRAAQTSPLLAELFATAYGELYPAEVAASSSCTWWTLGQLVTELGPAAGGRLLDLGCGRGGPGLWVARALPARLVGIDVSPLGIELAAARAASFLPAGGAEFRVATFEATGLPDAHVDAVMSVDALPFSPDPAAAVREVHRVLRPGGRLAFTTARRTEWTELLAEAGLDVLGEHPDPGGSERWLAFYELVERHAEAVRGQLDEVAATDLLTEARRGLETGMTGRRPRLVVGRRPS